VDFCEFCRGNLAGSDFECDFDFLKYSGILEVEEVKSREILENLTKIVQLIHSARIFSKFQR